jgi:hypothetical protein
MANISTKKRKLDAFTLTRSTDVELMDDVIALINQLWGLPPEKKYVPCPNPSNLERKDLPVVKRNEYLVSPKIDGMRMFLLLGTNALTDEEYAVFIDRAYNIYPVHLSTRQSDLYEGTLLDGELRPTVSGDHVYTVFDGITIKGFDLKQTPFCDRKREYEAVVAALHPCDELNIVPKQWYPMSEALQVWTENQSMCDGLILQPVQGQLKAGIQKNVFKWKPVSHQTIDFYLSSHQGQVLMECGHGADIMNANALQCYFDPQVHCPANLRETRQVYECFFNKIEGGKVFFMVIKPRLDKVYANDSRVVLSTLQAIQENIMVDDFC